MKEKINLALLTIKKIELSRCIFSVLLSLMLVLSRHVVRFNADRSSLENVYFTDISFIDILLLILFSVLIYTILTSLPKINKSMFYDAKRDGRCIISFIVILLVILICWLPYVFSYWPGGIYSDTMNSVSIALGIDEMTTHEPIAYTLLWTLMYKIAGGSLEPGDYGAMYMFTIVQYLGLATLLASFVNWNFKRGLKIKATVAMTLIFALFPLFPYYAISLWKDTVFGIVIFLFSWHVFAMMEHIDNDKNVTIRDVVLFVVLSLLCAFTRNNGIYVLFIISIVIILANIKNKNVLFKIGTASAVTIAVCLIIQHPLFDKLNYNVDTAVESMAIPLEQTAYIVSTDGKLNETDITILEQIMPIDLWKEIYSPVNVDYLKFDGNFDRGYFNEHVGDFFKTYLHICINNPVKAIKGYLLATIGFWDVFEETGNAYICPESIAWTGIFQGDFFEYNLGISFRALVEPRHYIGASIWVWIMLFSLFFAKGAKNKVAIVPALGVWITIMLAVPLAFSFRYVFAVFLCLPIYWMCLVSKEA